MYNGMSFSFKREGNSAICDNMNEPGGIMQNEISQTQKDKKYVMSLLWRILNNQTHRCGDWNGDFQGLEGGGNGEV